MIRAANEPAIVALQAATTLGVLLDSPTRGLQRTKECLLRSA